MFELILTFRFYFKTDVYPDSSPLNNCQLTKETQTELFDSLEKDNGRSSSRHVAHLSCSVNGRHVIIVDDMIDTGHTINIALKVKPLIVP